MTDDSPSQKENAKPQCLVLTNLMNEVEAEEEVATSVDPAAIIGRARDTSLLGSVRNETQPVLPLDGSLFAKNLCNNIRHCLCRSQGFANSVIHHELFDITELVDLVEGLTSSVDNVLEDSNAANVTTAADSLWVTKLGALADATEDWMNCMALTVAEMKTAKRNIHEWIAYFDQFIVIEEQKVNIYKEIHSKLDIYLRSLHKSHFLSSSAKTFDAALSFERRRECDSSVLLAVIVANYPGAIDDLLRQRRPLLCQKSERTGQLRDEFTCFSTPKKEDMKKWPLVMTLKVISEVNRLRLGNFYAYYSSELHQLEKVTFQVMSQTLEDFSEQLSMLHRCINIHNDCIKSAEMRVRDIVKDLSPQTTQFKVFTHMLKELDERSARHNMFQEGVQEPK